MKQRPAPPSSLGYRNPLQAYVNHMLSLGKRWPLLQKPLLLIVFHSVLLSATAMAQDAPSIQWELVNPFRFIHDQNTIDQLKDVAGLNNKSAAELELALQKKSDAAVQQVRDNATNCNSPSPAEKRRCFAPYSGWFAKVADNDYARTCWDWVNHKYRVDARA